MNRIEKLTSLLGTKTVIHCYTQEEANDLSNLLRSLSPTNKLTTSEDHWETYGSQTCYSLGYYPNTIRYAPEHFYVGSGHKIIDASYFLTNTIVNDNYQPY
jgi:hypothetical protein